MSAFLCAECHAINMDLMALMRQRQRAAVKAQLLKLRRAGYRFSLAKVRCYDGERWAVTLTEPGGTIQGIWRKDQTDAIANLLQRLVIR